MPAAPPVTKAVLPANSRIAVLRCSLWDLARPYLHEAAPTDSELPMNSPRMIVFDLDGTLVDTAPDLISALN